MAVCRRVASVMRRNGPPCVCAEGNPMCPSTEGCELGLPPLTLCYLNMLKRTSGQRPPLPREL